MPRYPPAARAGAARGGCAPIQGGVCMAARYVRWAVVLGTIALTFGGGAALHLVHAGRAAGQTSGRPQPAQDPDPLAPFPTPPELVGIDLLAQSAGEAARKSSGCLVCHQQVRDPHFKDT